MKKIVYSIIIVAIVLVASCSKDVKINKKIEGIWKVSIYEGEVVALDDEITYQFTKSDKKKGNGILNFKDKSANNLTINFSYTLQDKKLNITTHSTFIDSTILVYDVIEYSKTKIKITNTADGNITEMWK